MDLPTETQLINLENKIRKFISELVGPLIKKSEEHDEALKKLQKHDIKHKTAIESVNDNLNRHVVRMVSLEDFNNQVIDLHSENRTLENIVNKRLEHFGSNINQVGHKIELFNSVMRTLEETQKQDKEIFRTNDKILRELKDNVTVQLKNLENAMKKMMYETNEDLVNISRKFDKMSQGFTDLNEKTLYNLQFFIKKEKEHKKDLDQKVNELMKDRNDTKDYKNFKRRVESEFFSIKNKQITEIKKITTFLDKSLKFDISLEIFNIIMSILNENQLQEYIPTMRDSVTAISTLVEESKDLKSPNYQMDPTTLSQIIYQKKLFEKCIKAYHDKSKELRNNNKKKIITQPSLPPITPIYKEPIINEIPQSYQQSKQESPKLESSDMLTSFRRQTYISKSPTPVPTLSPTPPLKLQEPSNSEDIWEKYRPKEEKVEDIKKNEVKTEVKDYFSQITEEEEKDVKPMKKEQEKEVIISKTLSKEPQKEFIKSRPPSKESEPDEKSLNVKREKIKKQEFNSTSPISKTKKHKEKSKVVKKPKPKLRPKKSDSNQDLSDQDEPLPSITLKVPKSLQNLRKKSSQYLKPEIKSRKTSQISEPKNQSRKSSKQIHKTKESTLHDLDELGVNIEEAYEKDEVSESSIKYEQDFNSEDSENSIKHSLSSSSESLPYHLENENSDYLEDPTSIEKTNKHQSSIIRKNFSLATSNNPNPTENPESLSLISKIKIDSNEEDYNEHVEEEHNENRKLKNLEKKEKLRKKIAQAKELEEKIAQEAVSAKSQVLLDFNKLKEDMRKDIEKFIYNQISDLYKHKDESVEELNKLTNQIKADIRKDQQELRLNMMLIDDENKQLIRQRMLDMQKFDSETSSIRSIVDKHINDIASIKEDMNSLQNLTNGFEIVLQIIFALISQDEEDRRGIHLIGMAENKQKLGSKSKPVVSLKPECLSCTGQASSAYSAFKIACLNYYPSDVQFNRKFYSRASLIMLLGDYANHFRELPYYVPVTKESKFSQREDSFLRTSKTPKISARFLLNNSTSRITSDLESSSIMRRS
ncbi:hypothetical protein SteCoe_6671 [Stentor coeruleus]|uniref:Uncharacterized protein n=1 Tax=Stentor coeruleus TaxID=5963 RepID=A0A1R2CPH0_9CILI|nr:hypothetical protein SteCoe_6671 [Stentor coeruleus]